MPWYELTFYIFLSFGGASIIGLLVIAILRATAGIILTISEPIKKIWNHWF